MEYIYIIVQFNKEIFKISLILLMQMWMGISMYKPDIIWKW